MNYWLVKSEPFKYHWQQFQKDKRATWDGVRNYAARNNMRSMKKGDQVFFYHSNEGLEIVGLAKVVKEHYPDPTAEDETWSVVDLSPVKTLKRPVTLAEIKKDPILKTMALVRISRLSVSPVTEDEFNRILLLSSGK